MIEFYPQIRSAHIALALASGALFALRGAGALLVLYVVLGMFALRRARTRRARAACYAAALAVFLFVYSIARAHHPLGVFRALAG